MGLTDTTLPVRALSLKERQRAEREELILDAAERLLAEHGYQDLVMEQLAERVGIGKGTIYLHFPRKEDLVAAIMVRGLERMAMRIASIAEGPESPTVRLQAIMEILIDGSIEWMSALEGAVRHELIAAVESHDAAGLRFKTLFSRLMDLVGTVIDQGKAQGAFDPGIATPVAVIYLLVTGRASGSTHLTRMIDLDRATVKESISRLYFSGLTSRPAGKEPLA